MTAMAGQLRASAAGQPAVIFVHRTPYTSLINAPRYHLTLHSPRNDFAFNLMQEISENILHSLLKVIFRLID